VIVSAATNISSACPLPIKRGRRWVPPQPVMRPSAAPRCPKERARSGDSAITGESKVETSAHAVAFYPGGNWGGEIFNRVHEYLPQTGEFIGLRTGQRGNFIQVGTHGEEARIAGNDQWGSSVG